MQRHRNLACGGYCLNWLRSIPGILSVCPAALREGHSPDSETTVVGPYWRLMVLASKSHAAEPQKTQQHVCPRTLRRTARRGLASTTNPLGMTLFARMLEVFTDLLFRDPRSLQRLADGARHDQLQLFPQLDWQVMRRGEGEVQADGLPAARDQKRVGSTKEFGGLILETLHGNRRHIVTMVVIMQATARSGPMTA